MKGISSIFGSRPEIKTPPSELDDKSIEYFRQCDLSRGRFSYALLGEINWWPDEMLTLLEILRLGYSDFINSYVSTAGIFDQAIRNVIYFMNQKKYSQYRAISEFINHGDFKIPDNYLNAVINEDNCYMREIDDRKRSSNERKHYLLARAIEQILLLTPIADEELIFKREYEQLIRLYITIYNLKNMYAIVDDTLRNILSAAINGDRLGISLANFLEQMLEELDLRVVSQIRKHHDDQLFTKIHTFRDLMLYAHHSTRQFDYVFNFRRIEQPSPEQMVPKPLLDPDSVKRIEYLYKFYLNVITTRQLKVEIISNSGNFEELISKTKDSGQQLITPRYIRRHDLPKPDEKESSFIVDNQVQKKKHPKMRKASMDVTIFQRSETMSPRLVSASPREDVDLSSNQRLKDTE